ncbi:hypothetical protein O1K_15771 [Xanthomonas fragariae LMG 25863]|nr:hypothetical protein O1K_15771 [Xanthomonas fragariae LMG 25863]
MSIQAMRAVTHPSSRSGGQSQWVVLADAEVGGIGAPDSAHMIERVLPFAMHCVFRRHAVDGMRHRHRLGVEAAAAAVG